MYLNSQQTLAAVKLPSLPYQNLPQGACALAINELLRIRKLNVHVRVDAYQPTVIFSLAPFETDDDRFVDTVNKKRGQPAAST